MILKLTKFSWDGDESPILIGTESIIDAESVVIKHHNGRSALVTKIQSRGAMVETNYVLESVDTIHEMTL